MGWGGVTGSGKDISLDKSTTDDDDDNIRCIDKIVLIVPPAV